jgi:hypothetical protein
VQKIFVEQIDWLTVRHGRASVPARRLLEPVALALGGRAGARLTGRLSLGRGRMTLLRLLPHPAVEPAEDAEPEDAEPERELASPRRARPARR